ncbi:hypothetical protein ACFL6M_02925 [Candidatus Eisenbacteria bacterium]|uniref:Peptidase C-terminal archaeal/bacterial domain-containing protein n=1 Tax=Eiseniibacteriota bacterium TaxID=2212470 RepID=A0ABV6YJK9_UNCEI
MTRILLVLLFGLVTCATPSVADWSSPSNAPSKGDDHVTGVPTDDPRVGGDTIETATVIDLLPFTDTGNTCEFAHDYDEICPYGGSLSPDVVYVYTSYTFQGVDIDLCDSDYDTKVYVYDFDAGYGFGNPYACNDDGPCGVTGYQSYIQTVFEAGHTYYIVVDGYGNDCGEYHLGVFDIYIEYVTCPDSALEEGEEDCYDGYDDQFNGGCNTLPDPIFSTLNGTCEGEAFEVCGTAGTYLFEGLHYRDTDWYELDITEESTVTFMCTANFQLLIFMIDGNNGCEGLEMIDSDEASLFPDYAILEHTFTPGTYWFWVGPSVFDDVPCGSVYLMTISGYVGSATPVPATTWGSIKSAFR